MDLKFKHTGGSSKDDRASKDPVDDSLPVSGSKVLLKVIGVGGGGCNAVKSILSTGLEGVECIAANTDMQALRQTPDGCRLQIGRKETRGRGTGANPETGKKAAVESREDIAKRIQNPEMLFIATCLGGGTGTGAAPVIAKQVRDLNRDTMIIAVVCLPFEYENRMSLAMEGVEKLRRQVDAIYIIPNQKCFDLERSKGRSVSAGEAYDIPDGILLDAVLGICDIINSQGERNLDFEDIKTVMKREDDVNGAFRKDAFRITMGTGTGKGSDVERLKNAVNEALENPLLGRPETKMTHGVLINVTISEGLYVEEEDWLNNFIGYWSPNGDNNPHYNWGYVIDKNMEKSDCKATIIITSHDSSDESPAPDFNDNQDKRNKTVGFTWEPSHPDNRTGGRIFNKPHAD